MSLPRATLIVTFLLALGPAGLHADESLDAIRDKIFDNWDQRQTRYRTAKYVIESTDLMTKGSMSGMPETPEGVYPPEDVSFETRREITIDLDNSLLRIEGGDFRWISPLARFEPMKSVTVFDGTTMRFWRPRDANPILARFDPELSITKKLTTKNPLNGGFFTPLQYFHGLAHLRGLVDPIRHPAERERFHVQEIIPRGAQGSAVILREPIYENSYREYTVELDADCRLTDYTEFGNDSPVMTIEITSDDSNLPKNWTERWTQRGALHISRDFRLTSHEVNGHLPESTFQVPLLAGMVVHIQGEGRRVVDADGMTLLPIPRDSRAPVPTAAITVPRRSVALYLIAANVVAIAAIASVVVMRRRRSVKN